jgi:hypothetical protein
VKLKFISGQSCAETETDDSGKYAISLAPAVYTVEASLAGFCSGKVTHLVVGETSVRAGVSLYVSVGWYQGPDTLPLCTLQQETIALRTGRESVSAHVMFGSKTVANGTVEYKGQPSTALQSIINFGTFLIKADSILVNESNSSVRARGKVLVSDSNPKTERRGSIATMDPRNVVSMKTVVVDP